MGGQSLGEGQAPPVNGVVDLVPLLIGGHHSSIPLGWRWWRKQRGATPSAVPAFRGHSEGAVRTSLPRPAHKASGNTHGRWGVRVFVFSLIGLILLAVLADYGTAAYAEYRVSREIRHELVLNTDPDVRVTGFPFLTQVAEGDFSQVNVHVAGVPMAGLATVTIGATLRNAKVSASQIFGGDPNPIVVGELDSRIRINDTQLGQLLGIPDLTVSAPVADPTLGTRGGGTSPAPRSGIILTGTVTLGGLVRQRISVNANVALQGKTVP